MKLYTVEADGRVRLAAEHNGALIDLAAAVAAAGGRAAHAADLLTLIRGGAEALDEARSALRFVAAHPEQPGLRYAFDEVRVLAPLVPGKMLCSGVNYRSHGEENPGAVLPDTPGFFAKLPNTIIGPGEPIVLPQMSQQVDYEVEFAVVIGRRLRRAAEAEALNGVFGYTILHDVSARDVQFKAPQHNQITLGKNFDSFCPLGPCVVTTDELTRPEACRIRTLLNGVALQDGSTADWLFPLPYLLSFLSRIMTLEPGDIVTTGTPAGVGVFRKPPVYLQPGDLVALEIEGIGRLENPVVADELR
jgi:2,4-didehydro-3-deoxy-L-rhamnonate hydrolase